MSRVIKFRQWVKGVDGPVYWGFFKAEDGSHWNGPCTQHRFIGESEQFTGLHDRNGKEIYEGDILEFDAKEWGDDRTNKFVVTQSESDGAWQGCGTPSEWKYFCKVIGNNHENKELLP